MGAFGGKCRNTLLDFNVKQKQADVVQQTAHEESGMED